MKKPYFICAIIAIIILGWGFFVFQKIQGSYNTTFANTSLEKIAEYFAPQEKEKSDSEKFNEAIEKNNATLCENIENSYLKNSCNETIRKIAIQKIEDHNACDSLEKDDFKILCHDNIYTQEALKNKNTAICEKVSIQKQEQCISQTETIILDDIAKIANISPDICNQLKTKKEVCHAIAQEKNDSQKLQTIIQNNNIAECDTLLINNNKTFCRDKITFKQAKTSNSLLLCQNIVDTNLKNQCQKSEQYKIDIKYYKQAKEQQNEQLCQSISEENIKTECNDLILQQKAKRENNPEWCEKIQNPKKKIICSQSL